MMNLCSLVTPPFDGFHEAIGIDGLSETPIIIRTRRLRGKLCHERIEISAAASAGRQAVIGCLSNRESVIRRLEAPFTSTVKARRVFPALLDLRLPFPETDCESVFLDIGPGEQGGTQALAVAARRAAIQTRLAAYQNLPCDPISLDQEALALWTQSLLEDPPAPAADHAAHTTRLVIALRGRNATLCIGRDQRLQTAGNLTDTDAAGIERRLQALAIASDHALDIRWTGPGAADHGTVTALIERFEALRPARHYRHHDPATMLARALTTRALTAGPLRCNLRRGPLLHPAMQRRAERRLLTAAAAAALTGLSLLVIGRLWQMQTVARDTRLRHAVVARAETIIGSATGLRGQDVVDQARRQVAEITATAQPFANRLTPNLWNRLITITEQADRHGIRIHHLEIEEGGLALHGSAATWEAVTRFSRQLEAAAIGPLTAQRQWDAETDDDQVIFRIVPQR